MCTLICTDNSLQLLERHKAVKDGRNIKDKILLQNDPFNHSYLINLDNIGLCCTSSTINDETCFVQTLRQFTKFQNEVFLKWRKSRLIKMK